VVIAVLVLDIVGSTTWMVLHQEPGPSGLDTELDGVEEPATAEDPEPAPRAPARAHENCSKTYGGDPARNSDYAATGHGRPTKQLWARRVGSLMEFPPSICDGILYVNTAEGLTLAVDSTTGKVVWKRKTGSVFDTTPAIAGNRLVIGGIDGYVTALDRSNGKRLWRLKTGAPVESSPVVIDDTVYVASLDRRVYALRLRTGKVKWAYRSGGDIKGSPVVQGGSVYAANYAGEVFALNRTNGKRKWRQALRIDALRTERIYSSTPVAAGLTCFGTVGGSVRCHSAKTGKTRWSAHVGGYVYSTPAISQGRLFIGGYNGRLYAFRLKDGKRLWSASVGAPMSASPVVIGKLVYASALRGGGTHAFDAQSGRKRWSHPTGKYVPGIATDQRIYLSLNGVLSAWRGR
jgi:outer membrane protein assembly factor BamB